MPAKSDCAVVISTHDGFLIALRPYPPRWQIWGFAVNDPARVSVFFPLSPYLQTKALLPRTFHSLVEIYLVIGLTRITDSTP